MTEKKLVVNEKFVSIQGEGYWVGTPMSFVRLAGCPVGGGDRICKDYTSREFPCDTKYQGGELLTVREVVDWCVKMGQNRVCITGGEPFSYDLSDLVDQLSRGGFRLHIE